MKTKITTFIAAIVLLLFDVSTAVAQGTKAYFKKDGVTVFESAISDIDSIVFRQANDTDHVNYELSTNTLQVDDILGQINYSDETGYISLSSDYIDRLNIKIGSVLLAAPNNKFSNGLMEKVVGLVNEGSTIKLITEPAALDEVFSKLHVPQTEIDLSDKILEILDNNGMPIDFTIVESKTDEVELRATDITRKEASMSLALQAGLVKWTGKMSCSLTMKYAIEINEINGEKVSFIEVQFSPSFKFDSDITLGGEAESSLIGYTYILAAVPIIPSVLWLTPYEKISLVVKAKGNIDIHKKTIFSINYNMGLTYNNGYDTWFTPIPKSPDEGWQFKKFEGEVGIGVKAESGLCFNGYDKVGIGLGGSAMLMNSTNLDLTAPLLGDPKLKTWFEYGVNVFARTKLFKLLDTEFKAEFKKQIDINEDYIFPKIDNFTIGIDKGIAKFYYKFVRSGLMNKMTGINTGLDFYYDNNFTLPFIWNYILPQMTSNNVGQEYYYEIGMYPNFEPNREYYAVPFFEVPILKTKINGVSSQKFHFKVEDDNLTLYPGEINFQKEGGTKSFSIETDLTVTNKFSDQTWCQVPNNDYRNVNVTVDKNETPSPRTATITVEAINPNTFKETYKTVLITQEAGDAYFTLSQNRFDYRKEGGRDKFTINTNLKVTDIFVANILPNKENENWCRVEYDDNSPKDVYIIVAENKTTSPCQATITVKAINPNIYEETSKTVLITQEAGKAPQEDYLTLSTGEITFIKEGGTNSFKIETNLTNISVSSNSTWCHVPPTVNDTKIVNVTIDKNETPTSRTATITVKAINPNTYEETNKTVLITQEAGDVYFTLSQVRFDYGKEGGRDKFTINTNLKVTEIFVANILPNKENESWCKVEYDVNNPKDVYIIVAENKTTSLCQATITVQVFDPIANELKFEYVDVYQEAGDAYLNFIPEALNNFKKEGGTQSVKIETNLTITKIFSMDDTWCHVPSTVDDTKIVNVTVDKNETPQSRNTIIWVDVVNPENEPSTSYPLSIQQEQGEEEDKDCVLINGVCLATRNVGTPGTFVTNPEDYGEYYQWNCGIPAFIFCESYGSYGYGASPSWLRSNDPCPTGWRVPTYAELVSVFTEGWTSSKMNGVSGWAYSSPNTGQTAFIPYASYWDATFVSFRNDSALHLWVSDRVGDRVPSYMVRYDVPSFVFLSVYQGLSIRCVSE